MVSINIEQAQTQLSELIDKLKPGEEIEIIRNDQPIAKLRSVKPRRFGLGKGKLTVLHEDDDHLIDFQEYMP